ncbi:hypothetical protein ABZ434_01880 [Streptomyces sp. NPDC005761]
MPLRATFLAAATDVAPVNRLCVVGRAVVERANDGVPVATA